LISLLFDIFPLNALLYNMLIINAGCYHFFALLSEYTYNKLSY